MQTIIPALTAIYLSVDYKLAIIHSIASVDRAALCVTTFNSYYIIQIQQIRTRLSYAQRVVSVSECHVCEDLILVRVDEICNDSRNLGFAYYFYWGEVNGYFYILAVLIKLSL